MKYEALLQKGAFLCMNAGWRMEREKEQPLTGVFTGHPKGFGFVAVDGLEEDIYISAERVHGALHQDVVQVELKEAQEELGDGLDAVSDDLEDVEDLLFGEEDDEEDEY